MLLYTGSWRCKALPLVHIGARRRHSAMLTEPSPKQLVAAVDLLADA
jgi:hypothetical protein